MIESSHSGAALSITNNRSGKGEAFYHAARMREDLDIQHISLEAFLADAEEISGLYSTLIVLGGDGSQASVLKKLMLQKYLIENIKLLMPGIGGEKVIARSLGLMGDPLLTVRQVLKGDFHIRPISPLKVNIENSESTLASWSVLGGASNLILKEIENSRAVGMSDFQRRMTGVVAGIKRLREKPQYVHAILPDGTVIRALDAGITSRTFPHWTSHYNFYGELPAIFHYVAGLDIEKHFDFILRSLLLDVIANKFRISRNNSIIKYQALNPGEEIEIIAEGGISIDSEVSKNLHQARVGIAEEGSYRQVDLISRRQLTASKQ